MKHRIIDIWVGIVVLLISVFFTIFILKIAFKDTSSNYNTIFASFSSADGISIGTDIKISGVKVGEVNNLELNNENFSAKVEMKISSSYKIPTDSNAAIETDGIFGGKFISIHPGIENETIENHGIIQYTQSGISLEKLIGKFLLNK